MLASLPTRPQTAFWHSYNFPFASVLTVRQGSESLLRITLGHISFIKRAIKRITAFSGADRLYTIYPCRRPVDCYGYPHPG